MHNIARRTRQRGLSFLGLVFMAVVAVSVVAIGGQSVPIFLEYQAVLKAADKAAREGKTVPEVRAIFDRAATIDNIKSIQGSDLEVTKHNERVQVAFSYSREIALAGPAHLVYRFEKQIP
ncbi:DUF4845 domain-containing protein [Comamonas endophytica]|uniref:DUF4845 domain-containing protein n=1 Tax=Comamonas endophytica TaxID=2949090 RepID=A0ABY6GFH6_9BURK|nr:MULTISPECIES: DUF4845 domain-containing protein [unclassified Acidovorax]MCD2513515.1 DUF4845 domain-containing protein [Acidovorax sp. D4N7]UYG53252.1 DUF4845 domain-containing protein [Acidovorax sp. 5MLIR]